MQIGPYTYSPRLDTYFNDLWNSGKRDYQDLSESELRALTGLIMNEASSTGRLELITDNNETNNMMLDLGRYLQSFEMNIFPEDGDWSDSHKTAREYFLETIAKVATESAKYKIDELFANKHADEMYWRQRTGTHG